MFEATSFLKFFELAPRYLAVVAIVTGFALFAPNETLDAIGISQITKDHRAWVGGGFLVSSAIVLVGSFIFLKDKIFVRVIRRRKKQRFKERIEGRLEKLTEEEKQILRFYHVKETRSNKLKVDDGVVSGLVSAGIIYRSASVGDMLEGFAHNITDVAWDYIHKHPEILDGSTNTYRTDSRPRPRLY